MWIFPYTNFHDINMDWIITKLENMPSGGGGGTDPSPYTSNPAALGTTSPGSSANFSRGDHVHQKPTYTKSDVGLGNVDNVQQYSASNPPPTPTAAQVGAIASPASPTVGDFLVYTISGWDAVTMAEWQGGNY